MAVSGREVWRLYDEEHWSQVRIAEHFGITQPRVSQIIAHTKAARTLDGEDLGPHDGYTITQSSPHARTQSKAPRPSLTGRQERLGAMFSQALPEIDDEAAARIGQMLIGLKCEADDERIVRELKEGLPP
jgi:hypothetical protein